jgi:hypothetical protein
LPLHGAPPLAGADSIASRQRIDDRLERFIQQGWTNSAIVTNVNATDVTTCSALISQPLRHGPNWDRSARRHIAFFGAGMTSGRDLPGPPVGQSDIERNFHSMAAGGSATLS